MSNSAFCISTSKNVRALQLDEKMVEIKYSDILFSGMAHTIIT
jgi:hypothetical protein